VFKGEFLNDSTFSGEFVTLRQTSKIEGKRNPKAALPDPYSASHLKEGYSSIEFSFPDLAGKQVSLSDLKYKGNVRKIHTGFSGPATGKFYDEFRREFNGFIDQLVAEK
jgi:hypothetical protein